MKIIMLQKKETAINEVIANYQILDKFVEENFNYLVECAQRKGSGWAFFESDSYAPNRIAFWEKDKQTRLHANLRIKYANGVKYNELYRLLDEDVEIVARQIQNLIDFGTVPIKSQLRIEIAPC